MNLAIFEAATTSAVIASAVATIVSSLAWPGLILALLIWKRRPITRLTNAAIEIAESSSKVKIWEIEFDRTVTHELESSGNEASKAPTTAASGTAAPPTINVESARAVNRLVAEAPSASLRDEMLDSIRNRMDALAREYDSTRANMKPGMERTRAMNVIAAKMRTLGLAAVPLVDQFCWDESSPGRRLAGIAILQMQPNYRFLGWLCDRMGTEQPFIMYHASLAILNAVRHYGASRADSMRIDIERAL